MKEIMLDLETMDNRATASIATIGAIEFDPIKGTTGKEFYRIVDLDSCVDKGSTISAGTVYWWLQQAKPARDEIVDSNRVSIVEACNNFVAYCKELSDCEMSERGTFADFHVWGNGATFDNAIFRQTFSVCNIPFPVDFWNDSDVRTVMRFYPPQLFKEWKDNNRRKGYHNALADAKYQVQYMTNVLKELGVKELY